MSTLSSNIDFGGARGSNTGDQFQELWALQQVLDLLHPETDLKAVGVEGVRTETPPQNPDDPTWDGVDCALYYGGETLETANRIEFAQLKYSSANPEIAWSVARLTSNTAKKGNNSVIRKLADDFKGAKTRMKQGAQLKIRFISNQDLSAGLRKALEARWSGHLEETAIDEKTIDDLKCLSAPTGLSATEFQAFLENLDISECGSDSRFAVKEKVVGTVAGLLGDDVSSEVRDLQVRVRELMLPERAREIVTDKEILLWFGLSDREGLFPCPPDIRIPEHTVGRSAADEVVRQLIKGERLVLVHGVGGCGKTILMHQIADRLPKKSVTIFFDCYGGGRCVYSNDKRHLPENAFLHLANELAVALRLPLFIPRNAKYPATIRSFLAKLRSAGKALKQLTTDGMLLIIVDAADNAVTAANNANPPEHPFVHDLFEANLTDLPDNVKIVTSCRTDTARRASLRLPSHTPEVICPPFTLLESRQHLEIAFSAPSDSLVEQFHNLSNANPRVQAYAIATAKGDRTRLLEALLPGGKSLPDVLRSTFTNALNKLGQRQIFEKLVGALAFLPAPIAVSSIARITGCTEDTVRDFALDLVPGLRLQENAVTIADEDFDAFIKDKGSANRDTIIADIAMDFITTFQTDPYSSIHVADALIDAGRARDVLLVIEQDPQAAAIGDPILRRQVQIRRLKLSLAACRDVGSTTDALKTVLISAEAERDNSTLNEVLEQELDLSVEFAGSSLRRTILLDPDRIEDQGSFLAQDAVRAIRSGDRTTAREQLYFHEAWLKRRRGIAEEELERWVVTDRDISARVETILELSGPKAAFDELRRWRPRDIFLRVAYILVPQLITTGKVHYLKAILKEHFSTGPWDLILWVLLAMAGEPVDGPAIEKSLRHIRRFFIPDAGDFRISSYREDGWREQLLDSFITACELAFKLNQDNETILVAVNRILEVLEGKQKRRLYSSDVPRLDGLLRCWLLKETISGRAAKDENFIVYLKPLNAEHTSEKRRGGKRQKKSPKTYQTDNREVERLNKNISALFPVYSVRLEILSHARGNQPIIDEQLNKLGNAAPDVYRFDYDHDSTYLRDRAAQSVMSLLIVENIKVSELVKHASTLAKGRFSDLFVSHRQKLWTRMRLRTSELDELALLVAKATADIKGLRAASSDKLEAITRLSRLILPVSRDDAESLFNDAVNIAKEIDQEAFDQIAFVSVLTERVGISEQCDRKTTIAADILAFISGVAERLSGHDGFPWRLAVHALTCVDEATALAAISRWADDGTVGLDDTLDQFLMTALQRGIISPEVSTSLALLIGGSGGDLQKELVSRATAEPQKFKEVVEELAREILLLSPQDARLILGQEIVDRISQDGCPEGEWLSHLRETIAFLRYTPDTDNKSEEATMIRPDKVLRLTNDNSIPKEFEIDPQGRLFATPESIAEVLEAAEKSNLRYNDRNLVQRMRDASSSPKDRTPFLNALARVPEASISSWDRVEMIRETLDVWKGTPAVDRWCRESLKSVLIQNFHGATRWLNEGESVLYQLLDYTEANADTRLQIILAGVAQVGEALSSRTLFAIAGEIVRTLDAEDSCKLLLWYVQRLRGRLPLEDQSLCSSSEISNNTTDTIARFLFALMSDIDTRVRWKAAHALRRLAKLGCFDIVKATVLQSSRVKDDAFRDPTGPFYSLAAKLWLTISLYRISAETPEALSSCKAEIFDLATSSELPHVGIREYAKRALLQLTSAGKISLTSFEKTQIDQVNVALKGQTAKKKGEQRPFGRVRDYKRRFKFDNMDTIPYWYGDILRFFPTVSQDRVLEIAERWILDKWGADPQANWWDKEPRKNRYNERRFGSWSHEHGSLPTIERYGTHLEWNAMHCVVGELLMTHPIAKVGEFSFYNFDYWLGKILPTDPPAWLSDNRCPTPLEARLWKEDPRTDSGWLHNIRRDEFLTEVGLRSSLRKGWIVVEGNYTVHFPKREANIRISSALVSPETAPALVRALQTESNPWGFRLPNEGDELQINVPPYSLVGWLEDIEGDLRFDDRDPFRYEVRQIRVKPGRKLAEVLELMPLDGSHRTWICNDTGEAALIYESWCDESPPEEDYYPRRIRSNGWRLWARTEMVRSFLTNGGWDLICEVQVERRLRNEYGWSYYAEKKRKTHDKILLLRGDGSVAEAKGRVGSWTGIGRGVGS